MRQRTLISGLAVSTVALGFTTYLLRDKSNLDKIKGFVQSVKKTVSYEVIDSKIGLISYTQSWSSRPYGH